MIVRNQLKKMIKEIEKNEKEIKKKKKEYLKGFVVNKYQQQAKGIATQIAPPCFFIYFLISVLFFSSSQNIQTFDWN